MSGATSVLRLALIVLAILSTIDDTGAQDLPPPPRPIAAGSDQPVELQLEVYVNGVSSNLIARFRQADDGALLIEPQQLQNVGLKPVDGARRHDGWIDISRLPGVSFQYDETGQAIRFSAPDQARAAKLIDAGKGPVASGNDQGPQVTAESGTGALLNYTLYASGGGDGWSAATDFQGVSTLLEGRAFSPFGVLTSSQVLSTSQIEAFDTTRLDTTWSSSDEKRMLTYSAGDIINGGLSWTRPVRLGGVRLQRNFALRPDMVTMPLPEFSGSAAVPSTVDVYVNNARRLSQDVPAGPFAIANFPVVTGAGTAQVVVRDSLGRETVSETPFFASSDLLAAGLSDFSAELGLARRSYGTLSNDYDERPVGSATLRYGMSDQWTFEAHAEGAEGFYNLGAGSVLQLGGLGVASLAGAYSAVDAATGYQLAASAEGEIAGLHLFARSQRTFGTYNDIASVTAQKRQSHLPDADLAVRPPTAIDQISLSSPLHFDATTLNLSLTHLETADGKRSRILGVTANRPVGERGNLFVTAYRDFEQSGSFGIFAGLSWSFGEDKSASMSVADGENGMAFTADASKAERQEVGSYGWRVRAGEGTNRIVSATGSYRSSIGRFEAGAEQFNDNVRTYGQLEGSIVAAGGDLFVSGRVDDAFSVVDAGAPGIGVLLENRPIGETNRRGRILLPGLRSYGENNISLDPTNLPLDAKLDRTKQVVKPSDRAGMVVDFKVETGLKPALITLRDDGGAYVEAGSVAKIAGQEDMVVGYDGQLYLQRTAAAQRLEVTSASGTTCEAEIAQVAIPVSAIATCAICRAKP